MRGMSPILMQEGTFIVRFEVDSSESAMEHVQTVIR